MTLIRLTIIILGLLSFSTSSNADQTTIRLTNGEWPPFMSQHLRHYGVLSHIITEAFALENINVEYGFFPWKRSYTYAKRGEWDGSVGWTYKKERESLFYYSDPIIVSSEAFFFLKQKPFNWNTYEDLKDKKIGASLGYWYGETFDEAEKTGIIAVARTTTDEQNMRKLLYKRIDLFVVNYYVGYSLLQKHFTPEEAEKITHSSHMVRETTWHLILSKKNNQNESMMIRFNKGLAKMKERGTTKLYLEKALLGEYELD